jgi:hypothetical protein
MWHVHLISLQNNVSLLLNHLHMLNVAAHCCAPQTADSAGANLPIAAETTAQLCSLHHTVDVGH